LPGKEGSPKALVDRQLVGLRTGDLAEMVNLAVVSGQQDGDPFLAGESRPQALPAQMNPLDLEQEGGGVKGCHLLATTLSAH
jgi:hypothetical protein